MKIGSLTSWGIALMLTVPASCGSSSGGTGGAAGTGAVGTGGTSGTAGIAGTAGTSGTGGAGGGTAGSSGAGGASNGGSGGLAGTAGGSGVGGAGGTGVGATLLVDDDNSDNNDPLDPNPAASPSDTLFTGLLAAEHITYTTYAVPFSNSTDPTGPAFSQLSGISTIFWYTGDNDSGEPPTLSSSQETTLEDWLDLGNKTLFIFSENLMFDLGLGWTNTNQDAFAANYLGLIGGEPDVDTLGGANDLADVNYVATGAVPIAAFNGLSFAIDADSKISSTADAVNPAIGTDALLTVQADPTDTGANSATAVASGHTKGTSKIIYVGIPLEDVHGAPTNTSAQLFHACLEYAGLVTN
jgi:hypothetical protein